MEKIRKELDEGALKYGLMITGGLTVYFLLMRVLGLHEVLPLRFLNGLIMAGGIYLALKHYRDLAGNHFHYLPALGLGLRTTAVGVGGFMLFMYVYLTYLDPGFMEYLASQQRMGKELNRFSASIALFLEGMGSGMVMSFMFLQWLKVPHSQELE